MNPALRLMAEAAAGGGGFDPLTRAGLYAWHDFSDTPTIAFSSGAFIAQIDDKTGNGNHLIQAGGAAQPDRSGTQNGLGTAIYDGSNDYMEADGLTVDGTTLTEILVAKIDAAMSSNARMGTVRPASGDDYLITTGAIVFERLAATDAVDSYRNGALGSKPITPGAWHILMSIFDGVNHTMYVDGVAGTPVANSNTFASTILMLGAGFYSSGVREFAKCEMGDSYLFTTALDSADRTYMTDGLAAKWGI